MDRNQINITDSEWEIMDVLWHQATAITTKEIRELLPNSTWTLATVKTLVNRLLNKNAISYEVEGKAYLYYAAIKKDEAIRHERASFIKKVFKGSKKDMIMNLVGDTELSDEEIDELRALLNRKRENES